MQIISNIALISINETLIVQLISFLIFLFVINRIMFRPLRKTVGPRPSLPVPRQQLDPVFQGDADVHVSSEGVTLASVEQDLDV